MLQFPSAVEGADRRRTAKLRRASSSWSLWSSSSGRNVIRRSFRHLHPALAVELFHPLESELEWKVGGGNNEISIDRGSEGITALANHPSDHEHAPLQNNGPSSHRHCYVSPPGTAVRRWHLLVGALALLDLLANGSWRYVGFWRVVQCGSNRPKHPSNNTLFYRPKFGRLWWPTTVSGRGAHTTPNQFPSRPWAVDGTLWAWLALHRNSFGALFSVAWLVDALVVAATDAEFIRDEEEEEKEEDRENVGAGTSNGGEGQTQRRSARRRKSSCVRFLRILAVQLLLLPVGLYQGLLRRCGIAVPTTAWVEAPWQSVGCWNDHDEPFARSSADSYDRRSIALIVVTGAVARFSEAVQTLQLSGAARAQALVVRTVLSNLYRPRRLVRSILDVLRLVRWIRCLLPVAGAAGNLANRVRDLRKRRRQRRDAREARRMRREELLRLPSQQIRERCAGRLQAAYRARRARRFSESLWRGDAEHLAALRLRKPLRASLARARRRLCEKRRCIERFRELQAQLRAQDQHRGLRARESPNLDDRKYLYRLERELRDEVQYEHTMRRANLRSKSSRTLTQPLSFLSSAPCRSSWQALWLLNRTLLVSPHSRFTVVWNALMVAGAAAEIASLVLALSSFPSGGGGSLVRSSAAHPPDTGNRAALRDALARSLVPRRWDRSPPCRPDIACHDSWSRCALRRLLLLVVIGRATPTSSLPQPQALPWYCAPTVAHLQSCLVVALEVAVPLGLRVLEAASGADVVVKVFTAVDDHNTDDVAASEWLRPPPAFRRWILPGLLLQLLGTSRIESGRKGGSQPAMSHSFSSIPVLCVARVWTHHPVGPGQSTRSWRVSVGDWSRPGT